MKDIDKLQKQALKYATEKTGKKTMVSDLIFRKEKGNYYAGFMILENISPTDLRIKRPTKWLLLDINTAILKGFYDIKEYDFSNTERLPLTSQFGEEGNSNIDGYSNLIIYSYSEWKNNILKQLEKKIEEQTYGKDESMLLINGKNISSKEVVSKNIDTILNDIQNTLIFNLRDIINKGLEDNYYNLYDKIIKGYKETGSINIEDNKIYLNLLKYTWPGMAKLIDEFDNINNI